MAKIIVYTHAYNAECTLQRAIDSILNQTYDDWEYHIADNGSTDGTARILSQYVKDSRFVIHTINKNNATLWITHLPHILRSTNAEWVCRLDADDTYSPDFMKKMYTFVSEHNLDVAACGYCIVDAFSGAVIKHRSLDKNLIIYGSDYADKFIEYRGFTICWWAKLASVALYLKAFEHFISPMVVICEDNIFMLKVFQESTRAGVLGEALYYYYQWPDSYRHLHYGEKFEQGFILWWQATRDYLTHYGEISKMNMDFLYAIFLSHIEQVLSLLYDPDIKLNKKLQHIQRIFNHQITHETLTCDADPQFRNLAVRKAFVEGVKDWVLAQFCERSEVPLVEEVLVLLENKLLLTRRT